MRAFRTAVLSMVALATIFASSAHADEASATSAAVHGVHATTADQVIVVSASAPGTSEATLTAYSWEYDHWAPAIGPVSAYLGPNGFTSTPHEADDATPVGQYAFTFLFGSRANPGTSMPYRVVGDDDHWIDDPESALYNTFQHGDADGRWSSAETLSHYDYAAAFDFNQNPVVPDGNSAIFLHSGDGPTGGCIAVGEGALLDLLRWLEPAARPEIVLGVGAVPPPHPDTPRPVTTTAAPRTVAAVKVTSTTAAPTSTTAAAPTSTTAAAEPSPTSTAAPSTKPAAGPGTDTRALAVAHEPRRAPRRADSGALILAAAAVAVLTVATELRRRRRARVSAGAGGATR